MKFFAVLLLALIVQSYAYRLHDSLDSLEEIEEGSHRNVKNHLEDPQASAYKTKVTQLINDSSNLSDEFGLISKLHEVADEKLDICKKPNSQELDKQCVEQTTVEVMAMIYLADKAYAERFSVPQRIHLSKMVLYIYGGIEN